MEHLLPKPDYKTPTEWTDWPFWEFDLPKEAFSDTLHPRFNAIPIAIQETAAFLLDVRDIAREAETAEQLFTRLEERRNRRLKEIRAAWADVSQTPDGRPSLFKGAVSPALALVSLVANNSERRN